MILDATNKSVDVKLGAAVTTNQLHVTLDFVETTTTTHNAKSTEALTNGSAQVEVLAAPASGTVRKVNSLIVHNADTASATVTVSVNVGGTRKTQANVALAAGETLGYCDAVGWYAIDTAGGRK